MREDIGGSSHLIVWMHAIRPKTLPAAAAPVIVGTALAYRDGAFQFGPAIAALCAALLLQIGANLANDVFDYRKGADTKERLGPVRVTQAGLLTPEQVFKGMWVSFGIAALCGVYLTFVAGWIIVLIGVLAIAAAAAALAMVAAAPMHSGEKRCNKVSFVATSVQASVYHVQQTISAGQYILSVFFYLLLFQIVRLVPQYLSKSQYGV